MKMRDFRWVPGQGIDTAAVARLQDHFRRPKEPMGEAWFIGEERRMFPELLGDLSKMPAGQIQQALTEITSGTSSFGPMQEWSDWYHYLLGQMVPRCHDGSVIASVVESLVAGFMAVYPNGVHGAPYEGFRKDALLTLGRCMMEPQCWNGHHIVVGKSLHRDNHNPAGVWLWWDASGDFSSSMFFCLKFLPADLVLGWFRSVLEIPSPHWRAQVITWAVGAHGMLTGQSKWPEEWKIGARPQVSWENSHCLRAQLAVADTGGATPMTALLPEPAREDALHLLQSYFSESVLLRWLDSISQVDYLYSELAEIPTTFEELYLRSK